VVTWTSLVVPGGVPNSRARTPSDTVRGRDPPQTQETGAGCERTDTSSEGHERNWIVRGKGEDGRFEPMIIAASNCSLAHSYPRPRRHPYGRRHGSPSPWSGSPRIPSRRAEPPCSRAAGGGSAAPRRGGVATDRKRDVTHRQQTRSKNSSTVVGCGARQMPAVRDHAKPAQGVHGAAPASDAPSRQSEALPGAVV
jgi:hypothetical protein